MWCCPPDFHQNTMLTLSSWTPRALNYKHLLPSGWQFDPTGKSSCYQAWWWVQSLVEGERQLLYAVFWPSTRVMAWPYPHRHTHTHKVKCKYMYFCYKLLILNLQVFYYSNQNGPTQLVICVFNYHQRKYWVRRSRKHFWENTLLGSYLFHRRIAFISFKS